MDKPDSGPQMTAAQLRDLLLTRGLQRALLDLGGQLTLYVEDLDPNKYAITYRHYADPDRVVMTLISPERLKELRQTGITCI